MSQRSRYRSLSHRYSIFTGLLLAYIIFIFVAYDIVAGTFNPVKTTALALAAMLIAGAIAKYTNRLLGQPLRYLQEGITAVRQGRLEPIRVSHTGDEIEFLGKSFNAMIEELTASQREVARYQESLEKQIRQRTRALEKVSEKALAASQAKSEFLANMSHELRTPMSGVLGMIDMALDSNLDTGQREQLLTAKSCASTLLALLNDILDLSKIEAGKMELEKVPFNLRTLVYDCVNSLRLPAKKKGISIRCEVDPEAPKSVAGDPLRIRQIITNLLSNAVKFTSEGWVELRVEYSGETPAAPPQLVIHVTDTGAGIPPEKLSAIFEEFTQADGSISRKYGGTGLGLTITRRLVEIHGGAIAVDSTVGEGSHFRVTIPCRPVAEVSAAGAGRQRASGKGHEPRVADDTKPLILVVEDNEINQKVVSAVLRKHGYGVVVVNHGGEATAALESAPVSLVLMDLQMPVVNGLEATRMIRQDPRWRDLPIIAMTAHAMPGDREACLREGMNDYISKPVSRPQLIAVVEKHIWNHARKTLAPVTVGAPDSAAEAANL